MSDGPLLNPNQVIPVGTQIVTRIEVKGQVGDHVYPHGAVGIVVAVPDEGVSGYLVRIPDGYESVVQRKVNDSALMPTRRRPARDLGTG